MKCLLVFAVVLAAIRAEEVKVVEAVKPLTYAYPAAHPFYTPIVYNTHQVVTPTVAVAPAKEVVHEYQPVQYVAKPQPYDVEIKVKEFEPVKTGCKNFLGFEVPCKQKRDTVAVEAAKAPVAVAAVAPVHTFPTVYHQPAVYHQPIVYHQPTVHKTKVLPTKVHEIPVATPQFKKVVEKVPLQPLCTNNWGMAVPCVHSA